MCTKKYEEKKYIKNRIRSNYNILFSESTYNIKQHDNLSSLQHLMKELFRYGQILSHSKTLKTLSVNSEDPDQTAP